MYSQHRNLLLNLLHDPLFSHLRDPLRNRLYNRQVNPLLSRFRTPRLNHQRSRVANLLCNHSPAQLASRLPFLLRSRASNRRFNLQVSQLYNQVVVRADNHREFPRLNLLGSPRASLVVSLPEFLHRNQLANRLNTRVVSRHANQLRSQLRSPPNLLQLNHPLVRRLNRPLNPPERHLGSRHRNHQVAQLVSHLLNPQAAPLLSPLGFLPDNQVVSLLVTRLRNRLPNHRLILQDSRLEDPLLNPPPSRLHNLPPNRLPNHLQSQLLSLLPSPAVNRPASPRLVQVRNPVASHRDSLHPNQPAFLRHNLLASQLRNRVQILPHSLQANLQHSLPQDHRVNQLKILLDNRPLNLLLNLHDSQWGFLLRNLLLSPLNLQPANRHVSLLHNQLPNHLAFPPYSLVLSHPPGQQDNQLELLLGSRHHNQVVVPLLSHLEFLLLNRLRDPRRSLRLSQQFSHQPSPLVNRRCNRVATPLFSHLLSPLHSLRVNPLLIQAGSRPVNLLPSPPANPAAGPLGNLQLNPRLDHLVNQLSGHHRNQVHSQAISPLHALLHNRLAVLLASHRLNRAVAQQCNPQVSPLRTLQANLPVAHRHNQVCTRLANHPANLVLDLLGNHPEDQLCNRRGNQLLNQQASLREILLVNLLGNRQVDRLVNRARYQPVSHQCSRLLNRPHNLREIPQANQVLNRLDFLPDNRQDNPLLNPLVNLPLNPVVALLQIQQFYQ